MHTVVQAREGVARGGRDPAARVAVAGATGYTGQELLRLLARHPAVTITAAMSSGARSTTSAAPRRLPALAHIFSGVITPLDADALARDADLVLIALPASATADLVQALVATSVRVINLSGAFRLRDRE